MKKYEYKVISKATPVAMNMKKMDEMAEQMEAEFNEIGVKGWEFVQWKNSLIIFKREVFS